MRSRMDAVFLFVPLPAMKNTVTRAYQLADGQAVPFKGQDGRIALQIATPIIDAMATVVVVEIEGGAVTR